MSSCTRIVTGSQKQLIGGRNGQNYGTLKWAHRSNQSVSASTTYEKHLRIEKTRLSHRVWSHGGSTFKKNDIKRPFFPPCTNWHTHCLILTQLEAKMPLYVIPHIRSYSQQSTVPTLYSCFKLYIFLFKRGTFDFLELAFSWDIAVWGFACNPP